MGKQTILVSQNRTGIQLELRDQANKEELFQQLSEFFIKLAEGEKTLKLKDKEKRNTKNKIIDADMQNVEVIDINAIHVMSVIAQNRIGHMYFIELSIGKLLMVPPVHRCLL